MSRLFEPGFVYPCDEIGPFEELTGMVLEVDDDREDKFEWEQVRVVVETEQGVFTGYTPRSPKVGYQAIIRVYQAGGGWYPDNRIVGWTSNQGESNVDQRSYRRIL